MKKIVFAVFLAAFAFGFALRASIYAQSATADKSAGQALPQLTPAEKADGWKLMFDGKSLNGWRGYKTEAPPAGWKIVNGELALAGGEEGGDLMTVEQYGDFEMRFDWKISENGNSGVIYRIATTEQSPWQTGAEYQVLHNAGHSDGKLPITSAGSVFAVKEPIKDVTKPLGEWNEARIVAKGNHIEHWMNGIKIVEYEVGSPDWVARVQASKFAKLANYGRIKSGYIALQDHGNAVSYRNLKIKKL